MNRIEELEKLQQLKVNGVLTDEEFEQEKKLILNDISSNDTSKKNKKNKQKMKHWQIAIMIILIIVARIYNICY